jgi:hypothetical protein
MRGGPSPCHFCGSVQGLHCYPTDALALAKLGVEWMPVRTASHLMNEISCLAEPTARRAWNARY